MTLGGGVGLWVKMQFPSHVELKSNRLDRSGTEGAQVPVGLNRCPRLALSSVLYGLRYRHEMELKTDTAHSVAAIIALVLAQCARTKRASYRSLPHNSAHRGEEAKQAPEHFSLSALIRSPLALSLSKATAHLFKYSCGSSVV